jgi:ribosomal protein S18 acetylase RimI-like enzyme
VRTEPRLLTKEELALAQWRNSCALWRRQCAEPEAKGVFELHSPDPYLLVLEADQSALPHLARLEQAADPDIEAFAAMYQLVEESPNRSPLSLRLHPSVNTAEWREFLVSLGFQPSTVRQVAMGRSLAGVSPAAETDLEVMRIETGDDARMAQAMEANGEAFGSPPSHRRFFLNPRTVEVYLALFQGTPAGSATAAYIDETVGVYGVATRPGFRGRGVASALVARILEDAAERAEVAILDCQHELVSLYQRSGFEVAREMPTYLLLAARR